jgi:ribosomal protein L40E
MVAEYFTITWCTAAMLFVYWPLREPFRDDPYLPDVIFYPFLLNWLLAMSSYFVGFFTPPGRAYKYEVSCTQLLKDGGFCAHCGIKRPQRAHHCRVCGTCSLRMDHHCIWLKNCIGLRNYKPFFLFVWYYWFGCIAYDVMFVYYCFFQSTEFIESWVLWFLFYLHCIVCLIFLIFVTVLLKMQIGYMTNNATTLESLFNERYCCLPIADAV